MTRPRRWTDDDLREAVAEELTIAGVIRRLGLRQGGGTHQHIRATIRRLGIDTDHLLGRSALKGKPGHRNNARSLEEILVADSARINSGKLRLRLIREGLLPGRCQMCGIDEWRGQVLSLELDHINGNRSDNQLENLRILCPNCHATTDLLSRENQNADVAQLAEARRLGRRK